MVKIRIVLLENVLDLPLHVNGNSHNYNYFLWLGSHKEKQYFYRHFISENLSIRRYPSMTVGYLRDL